MNRFFSLILCYFISFVVYASVDNDELPQLGKDSIKDVIRAMTLDEKIHLLIGNSGVSENLLVATGYTKKLVPGAAGTTFPIPRLGIPAIVLADGPSGLRISPRRDNDTKTYYCTAFPIPSMLASSWNKELVYQVGEAMGNEVLEYGCDVLLAPAINIQRNPLCGRNYEYYSEDPYLCGKIAVAMVKGIQQNGVGTSVKHFLANNQETNRIANDVIVSNRALREIYLMPFEMLVKEAQPWTIMSSYNKVGGVYTSESHFFLEDILRKEWMFNGIVITDWFGGRDAVQQVLAGNDLLMPGKVQQFNQIKQAAISDSKLLAKIDENLERILELITKTPRFKSRIYSNNPDLNAHARICRTSAVEGIILLKNKKKALPLKNQDKNIALFGNTSYDFLSGGTGSGDVDEAYTVSLDQAMDNSQFQLDNKLKAYYKHYLNEKRNYYNTKKYQHISKPRIEEMSLSDSLIKIAAEVNDVAIVTIGRNSGEYSDRYLDNDFCLGEDEIELINNVSSSFHKQGKKVIAILNIGGVVEMASWEKNFDAILLAWQGGQEGGNAVLDILNGEVSPSGKLPMTIPIKYEDHLSANNFPLVSRDDAYSIYREFYTGPQKGNRKDIDWTKYDEDIYVGYRFFDKSDLKVVYPFGFGLSYTSFSYNNLNVNIDNDSLIINLQVKNTGNYVGKEIVQVYVGLPEYVKDRPLKELKAFEKTELLSPGTSQFLRLTIPLRNLMCYSEEKDNWIFNQGRYHIMIGSSSRDIRLKKSVFLTSNSIIR